MEKEDKKENKQDEYERLQEEYNIVKSKKNLYINREGETLNDLIKLKSKNIDYFENFKKLCDFKFDDDLLFDNLNFILIFLYLQIMQIELMINILYNIHLHLFFSLNVVYQ